MSIGPEERLIPIINKSNLEKMVIVTGATSGIGLAASEQLARAGAVVIGIGRSEERCRAAEDHLRALHPSGKARYLTADLSLLSEVRLAAVKIRETLGDMGTIRLDGLLNNAGTFSLQRRVSAEGFETTWALNHLAPFLLTHELLPLLQTAPAARVVTVSSGSHYGSHMNWDDVQLRRRYNGLQAYGQSKLANVLFTLELNRRLGPQHTVQAFAADPGLVKTRIGVKGTPVFIGWVWTLWSSRGITPEETAKGIVKLLLDPSVRTDAGIYWKHGKPVRPDPEASNPESARRLWEISEHLCRMSKT